MKKHFVLLLMLVMVLSTIKVSGQISRMLPVEIKSAYQKGTRSHSGYPGVNYWQNNAKYEIQVELNAENQIIKGEERVTYFNNSPDSLDKIVMRLYPDLFKEGNAKEWSLGAEALTKGTLIDYLKVNGEPVDLDDSKSVYRSSTNLHIILSDHLPQGDSLIIETKWQFDVPAKRPVRTGYYGDDLFFIAYWYPQVAVYDDIDGWDKLNYLGTVEYYNDFNDYDVQIKVPENYMVWATGKLQNEDHIYSKQVLKQLDKARGSDEVVKIINVEDCKSAKVLKNNTNTWHFVANHVPDFSFASAQTINWAGSSLLVDESTNRRVFIDAVYPDNARTYDTAALWARNSVKYMSFELPGYPFPYEHITTFSNNRKRGGMESPMMANNGDPYNSSFAASTIFHEIAHTYFPFFMGTNERKYAWMDEGWAAFFPSGFVDRYYPERNYTERGIKSFEQFNGKEREATLMTLSYLLGGHDNYRQHAYVRSSLAYAYLHDALGDSTFKLALHSFINRWNGKHPLPYDFFNTFSDVNGNDLDWFFIPWFFEKAQADQGIKKVTLDNKIVIENIGGLPLPVNLMVEYEDGSIEKYYENTSIWSTGSPAVIIISNPEKKISKVVLGSGRVPDINKINNELKIVSD